jgi:isopenicillin N synthase-like dioxygenase
MIPEYPHKLICPQVVECDRATIVSWTAKYHGIGLTILDQLSQALELTDNLTKAHDPLTPSTSSISLLKYMARQKEMDGGHVAHTDIGTLTLLYSLVDGLQIFHPIRERWLWVEPRRGSLVVNVGDSLSLLTSQRLKSCLHRVIPHPNAQGTNRYSVAYFMRPNENVALDIGEGQRLNSMDWHFRKLKVFAAPLAAQKEQHDVLHGRF